MNEHDQKVEALRAEAAEILNNTEGPLSDEQRSRLDAIETEMTDAKVRARAIAQVMAGDLSHLEDSDSIRGTAAATLQHLQRKDPWNAETRTATPADLRARALSAIEATTVGVDVARESASRAVQDGDDAVSEWAIRGTDPAYCSAFLKYLNEPEHARDRWTDDERRAVAAVLDTRAMGEGSASIGGAMVPSHLDPAIMLQADGQRNSFRQVSKVVQLAEGKQWAGVTSGGVVASYTTEFGVAADNSPTLASKTIAVHRGHCFIPFSLEVQQDVSSLGEEIAVLFADARDEIDNTKFTTGSGTNEPTGVITALVAAGSGSWAVSTTNNSLVADDVFAWRRGLGPRFRRDAAWMMNLRYDDRIRALGTEDLYTQTVDLSEGSVGSLLGRPVYEASAMTETLSTTTNNAVVFADWKRAYTIVDRLGSTIEYIPHVFDQATGRPYGTRGFYLNWRSGADLVNTAAACLGVNQNTAWT